MKIPILDKDDSYNYSFQKLLEEIFEVGQAVENNDKLNLVEECLDVAQVVIGILDKLEQEGFDIGPMILKHEKKLIKRGWKFAGHVNLKVFRK